MKEIEEEEMIEKKEKGEKKDKDKLLKKNIILNDINNFMKNGNIIDIFIRNALDKLSNC